MEKFSQFRDRGSGIAPFLPISSQHSGIYLPFHIFLFCMRLPLLITAFAAYFCVLQWLPIGSLGKKASLWVMLGIPGIWWIDLQIDGVKKGSLASQHSSPLPGPASVIASSFTSPIDALYLAAIFDPIFTVSYPSTCKVQQISLVQAILRAFARPEVKPPAGSRLVDIATLIKRHPNSPIVVFPECTTTNGKGILQMSPSLVAVSAATRIFPVSLRYTPADITTPIPQSYRSFMWNLLSKPTHCIRVRIAESVLLPTQTKSTKNNNIHNGSRLGPTDGQPSYDHNYFNALDARLAESRMDLDASLTSMEQTLLNQVGESLARLGRVRRVGLGAKDKQQFVKLWTTTGKRK
ncbi:conserved hypothetical protein [Histoplasma capsulatum G186AR]|uniref:Vacuolar protein sorting protein Vps66 n=2 Tax=Ajellomyces capsulatus TaxID=5037 RepID=C0NA29_AJECG|nr:lysophosphatidic acid acyltransferase LOA1 [Histoplasma capsulatum G186AR]EEH11733.1 conserved hypothetical protein [Histoplasma capsulatum G186AR]KAG5302407.1 hypothetical protein I7I52_00041 [Histoplasma capsulatum]QSS72194.1 hypothetical protein I7I50_03291 [Histoplasma capsulatum G186AR]